MPVHSSWGVWGLPRDVYFVDEVGHKSACCSPLSLMQKNLDPLTPQFSTRKDQDQQTRRRQNKLSSMWEKLTRDLGKNQKRQPTNRTMGHLHLGAIPRIFSSCLWLVPSGLPKLPMTKLKEVSNELDALYLRENSPWIGGLQCLTGRKTLFPRDLGQEWVF